MLVVTSKGYFVVEKLVLNVDIKALWYTKIYTYVHLEEAKSVVEQHNCNLCWRSFDAPSQLDSHIKGSKAFILYFQISFG